MTMLAFQSPEQTAFTFEPLPRPPEGPREWPLRSLAPDHRGRFAAWRGRSGRRYVATAFPASHPEALGFADSVLLAVDAERRILAVREAGPWGVEAALERWRDDAIAGGAREIHVHLIAETAEERRRAVADLTPVH